MTQGRVITIAIIAGCMLDCVFADPSWVPHPVVLMGKCIEWMEHFLRRIFPKDPKGEFAAGLVMAVGLPAAVYGFAFFVCSLCSRIHPLLFFAVEALWCAQALAVKGLATEAEAVRRAVAGRDIVRARAQVSRIVGRDTDSLDIAGVTRACVETVAENASDGVIAPLFYMLIGGAPMAMAYKAINTMDSMAGYRNERYLYFGRAPARLDDAANFIPSRIAALLWIAAAFPDPCADGGNAWRIFRRDRRKHASPNSAQTESACAGSLHIRLAGPASYFGVRVEKPWIGDDDRPIEEQDIRRSVRLMWISSALMLSLGILIRATLIRAVML